MKFDVQWPKNNGVTALGIAALAGDQRAFHMLIDGGADPKFTNRQGIGALYLAIKGKSLSIIQSLVNMHVPIYNNEPHKLDNSPVFFAVKAGNIDAMEVFVDIGGDQMNHYVNSTGLNPLMYAASIGNFQMVNYLTSRGLLINIEDSTGSTVLSKVLEAYDFDLATKLIKRGADINYTNRDGKTALAVFVQKHRIPIIEYLLANQANPHIEDITGRDACDWAQMSNIS